MENAGPLVDMYGQAGAAEQAKGLKLEANRNTSEACRRAAVA
ncbi:hypothetical protein [Streptomyces noursei]